MSPERRLCDWIWIWRRPTRWSFRSNRRRVPVCWWHPPTPSKILCSCTDNVNHQLRSSRAMFQGNGKLLTWPMSILWRWRGRDRWGRPRTTSNFCGSSCCCPSVWSSAAPPAAVHAAPPATTTTTMSFISRQTFWWSDNQTPADKGHTTQSPVWISIQVC